MFNILKITLKKEGNLLNGQNKQNRIHKFNFKYFVNLLKKFFN